MQSRRGTLYHISNPAVLTHQTSVGDIKAIRRFSSVHFAVSAAGILKILVIGRRGTLYHISNAAALKHQASVADLKATKRFSSINFAVSAAGILKIVVIVVFLVAAAVFLASDGVCSDPLWWLFPLTIFIIIIVMAIVYALFMLGMAEDNISVWVKIDLVLSLVAAVVAIAVSSLAITECDLSDTAMAVSGPMGLVGACMLVVSAAAMFVMWRYRDEEPAVATAPAAEEERRPARKSVYV